MRWRGVRSLPYLASLLLEREQLFNSGLCIALRYMSTLVLELLSFLRTAPSFSASGIAASASLVKSLSALSTSPLDMMAGSSMCCYLRGAYDVILLY